MHELSVPAAKVLPKPEALRSCCLSKSLAWLMVTIHCHFCLRALGALRQKKNYYGPPAAWQVLRPQSRTRQQSAGALSVVCVGSAELGTGTKAVALRLLWSSLSCPSAQDPLEALWDVAFLSTCL